MNSNGDSEISGLIQPLGLNEAYSVKTPDDNRRLYAKWAATYESDFVDKEKYRYPKAVAELFAQVVPRSELLVVIDVGTGTGLTGTYLSRLCPEMIVDGVDISVEMLGEARKKYRENGAAVYRDLFERDLTLSVNETRAPYDALICSGTFTHGHLGPDALDNLISLVRPSGWFVIGVNNEHFAGRGFEEKTKSLVETGKITSLEVRIIQVYEEGSSHYGDQARVLIFQK